MRLIDADALTKEAGKLWSEMPDGEELSKELMKTINHAPTVDAVPVVHGRWELVDEAEPRRYGCSECSCLSWYGTYRYCPNCGAKMDGGEADDHS